jgi:hypothetical protein
MAADRLSMDHVRMSERLLGEPCHIKGARNRFDNPAGHKRNVDEVSCPMCGRRVETLHPLQQDANPSMVSRLESNFPGWRPEDGLCESCLALTMLD